jgi:hypothetical protein
VSGMRERPGGVYQERYMRRPLTNLKRMNKYPEGRVEVRSVKSSSLVLKELARPSFR